MTYYSSANPRLQLPGIVLVCGPSNSGKTTLIERLIPRLAARGLRVGTLKHARHGFEMDHQGKDSWRHAKAGACAVAVVSPTQAAWLIQATQELSHIEAIERMASSVDIVLVEGFKQSDGVKILLESGMGSKLKMQAALCRIGIFPGELSSVELDEIARFCENQMSRHSLANTRPEASP